MDGFILLILIGVLLYRSLNRPDRNLNSKADQPGLFPDPSDWLGGDETDASESEGLFAPKDSWLSRRDVDTEALVRDVAYLQRRFRKPGQEPLEPFSVDPFDALDVHRATKRLASHVGLAHLRFIVGMNVPDPGRGGSIELTSGPREVFVEVTPEAGNNPESLIAVLAHEVTHKVLFDRNIRQDDRDSHAYEVLTDVAAIYLGFGKLLLNGYWFQTQDYLPDAVRTRTHQFGYISLHQVAFVHAFVQHAMGATPADLRNGLSPYARAVVDDVAENPNFKPLFENARHLRPSESADAPETVGRPFAAHAMPRQSSYRGSSEGPDAASTRERTEVFPPQRPPSSGDVARLHRNLLGLVYGDEKLAKRLVDHERAGQKNVVDCYRAAINRLTRDRARA